jgi:hypothetical protein
MKVLPLFFLLFCSVCSNAQDKRSIGWLNVGGGFAGSKNLTGMGVYSSLNAEFPIFKKPGSILQTDKFHKRYTSVGFRYSCLWGSGDEHYGGELRDLGFLFGIRQGNFASIRVCGGFGLFSGKVWTENEMGSKRSRALARGSVLLETGISFASSPNVGLGMTLYGNLNKESSLIGFSVNLNLGKLYHLPVTVIGPAKSTIPFLKPTESSNRQSKEKPETNLQTKENLSTLNKPVQNYSSLIGLRTSFSYSFPYYSAAGISVRQIVSGRVAVECLLMRENNHGSAKTYVPYLFAELIQPVNKYFSILNGLGINNDYKLVFLMGCEVTSGKIPMNISVDFKITPLTRVSAGLSLRYPIKHPDVQS